MSQDSDVAGLPPHALNSATIAHGASVALLRVMIRSLLLAAAFAFSVAAWLAPHARADVPKLALQDVSTTLTPPDADRNELSSIDAESTAATVVYAIGTPIHLLGLGTMALGGVVIGTAGGLGGLVLLAAGGLGAIVGLVVMAIAIGLDVDSGSRRSSLRRRQAGGLALTAMPTDAGTTVGLALTL
jgi:hypothetical protein